MAGTGMKHEKDKDPMRGIEGRAADEDRRLEKGMTPNQRKRFERLDDQHDKALAKEVKRGGNRR